MRTKLGLKVLGLSALVMGVMAIGTAGVAQGEAGACWRYLIVAKEETKRCFGENVGGVPLEPLPLFTIEEKTATLLIANVNLEVLCGVAKFDEGGQLALNGSILLGRIEFSECISLSRTPTLTKLSSCTPNDPVVGLGKVLTEKGTGLIVLHENPTTKVKEPVVEIKPDVVGGPLAKIFLGPECAVSEELIVTGKLILQDTGGKVPFEEHKSMHLIEEFSGLKLMKVGINSATIDGKAEVTLATPHNGLLWAGKPI